MSNIPAYSGNEPFIFVSYSHKDSDIVMRMINQMVNDGYRVWYDEGIRPGSEWNEFIADKIKSSGLFLAFVSENYLESGNCKDELNYARDNIDNILLVYLSNIHLPSGMEMRLSRTQAIPAYNYIIKEEFFDKLYSTNGIENYKGYGVPVSVGVRPPVRVDKKPQDNNRKLLIIASAVLVVLIIIFAIIVFALSGSSESKEDTAASSTAYTTTNNSAYETAASSDVITPSSETALETVATSATTEASVATTAPTTETSETTVEEMDEYEDTNGYSRYNLRDGDTFYAADVNPTFYNNTGAVYPGYLEGSSYQNGSFYSTDTMSIRIPALNDYCWPININWYAINSNNEIVYLFGEDRVVPTMIDGEMCYASTVSGSATSAGHLTTGTYYVTVNDPESGTDITVTRLFYSE